MFARSFHRLPPLVRAVSKWICAVAVLCIGMLGLLFVASYFDTTNVYEVFHARGDRALVVAGSATIEGRFGALDISRGGESVDILLEQNQWETLQGLVHKASNSAGDWRNVGDLNDDPPDASHLSMFAGRGFRLSLDQDGVCFGFEISRANLPRFERAVAAVTRFLAGEYPKPKVSGQSDAGQSAQNVHDTLRSYVKAPKPDWSGCDWKQISPG